MASARRRMPTEIEAFLRWENRQKQRYELVDGVVRAMSGGTLAHDLIAANIIGELRQSMALRPCFVHGSNLKVRSPTDMVTYPDVLVRCGAIADENATEIDDPVLIVEVLSPTTRKEDLHHKRWGYLAIPSLCHLLYVETRAAKVELLTREADQSWRGVLIEGLDATLRLEALDATLAMTEIYAGTRAGTAGA